jgi:hypothetical protein
MAYIPHPKTYTANSDKGHTQAAHGAGIRPIATSRRRGANWMCVTMKLPRDGEELKVAQAKIVIAASKVNAVTKSAATIHRSASPARALRTMRGALQQAQRQMCQAMHKLARRPPQ